VHVSRSLGERIGTPFGTGHRMLDQEWQTVRADVRRDRGPPLDELAIRPEPRSVNRVSDPAAVAQQRADIGPQRPVVERIGGQAATTLKGAERGRAHGPRTRLRLVLDTDQLEVRTVGQPDQAIAGAETLVPTAAACHQA